MTLSIFIGSIFQSFSIVPVVVAPALDGQLVAARVGLLRDLHGVVIISTQRFIAELDRDFRLL